MKIHGSTLRSAVWLYPCPRSVPLRRRSSPPPRAHSRRSAHPGRAFLEGAAEAEVDQLDVADQSCGATPGTPATALGTLRALPGSAGLRWRERGVEGKGAGKRQGEMCTPLREKGRRDMTRGSEVPSGQASRT